MTIAQAYYVEAYARRQTTAAVANACGCTGEEVVEYLRANPDTFSGAERAGLAVREGMASMTGSSA